MKIHKIGVYSKETLCGLNITSSAPDFEEPITDDLEEVTCPDCLEITRESNSKQQIMSNRERLENVKIKEGDQWMDRSGAGNTIYIITCFVISTEFYFFLISKTTGRIVGRLDVYKHRSLFGVPKFQEPPQPVYNEAARKALGITENMVYIADRKVGEDQSADEGEEQEQARSNNMAEGRSGNRENSGTYDHLKVQPWYFIEANQLSFLEGSIVKRVCRHGVKDGVKDIDKAIDELGKLREYKYGEFNISVYKDDDTEYSEMEDAPIGDAIKALSDKLKNDPEYCSTWKANIAMAFKDVISRITEGDEAPRLTLNEAFKVADKAAWEFLEKLKD